MSYMGHKVAEWSHAAHYKPTSPRPLGRLNSKPRGLSRDPNAESAFTALKQTQQTQQIKQMKNPNLSNRRTGMDWSLVDWTKSNKDLAAMIGVSGSSISYHRKRHAPETTGRRKDKATPPAGALPPPTATVKPKLTAEQVTAEHQPKKHWPRFFFDSNMFFDFIKGQDDWDRLRAAYPYADDEFLMTARAAVRDNNPSDGAQGRYNFGFYSEHTGETLADFMKREGLRPGPSPYDFTATQKDFIRDLVNDAAVGHGDDILYLGSSEDEEFFRRLGRILTKGASQV